MKNRITLALVVLAVSLCSLEVYAAAGRTVGQFAVSPSGSAQYTIPIFAPPGPNGMQPNISLFYDSRSPIGPLGVGWSIAGLGQITRCNKTVAQDTTAAPVALATTDGYCINGNRLRLTSTGNYGEAGSTYQTEIADFSLITAVGTAGSGPASFTVQGRNGLTYYYGTTAGMNSQVLAAGSSTALTWLLSQVVDRAGNNYVINYTTLSGTLIGTAVPSTINWTPASAGSSSYNYTMQFNYPNQNPPQSSTNKYEGGTQVSNTALLASIEILSGTTLVKDYFIGYTASPTTGRDQITSVTECPNATNSPSNCLSPTTITYAGPSMGLSTSTSYTALSSSGTNLTARYDLNGDGIPDLIYNNGTNWFVAFGSTSGYGSPVNTGIPASATVLPGNLNAGTEDGLLVGSNGSVWKYYTYNGATFSSTPTNLTYDSSASQYQLADVNGDGLPDLIILYVTGSAGSATANVDFRLNTTSSSTVNFSSTLTVGYSWSSLNSAVLLTPDSNLGKLRHYDFNGDGLDDLAITTIVPGIGGGSIFRTYELITTPNGTYPLTPTLIAYGSTAAETMLFINWNDDKCTDLAFNTTLYISGCNGTVPTTASLSGTLVSALDWDGDGRTDLLVATGASGTDLGVYLSKGVTSPAPTLTTTSVPYNSACQYVTMDATGGGLDDLGCWSSSGALTYYLHNGVPDLVTEFQDGFGNSASPSFVSIGQSNYVQRSDATAGYVNYIGPLYVTSEVVYSDPTNPPSGTYNQTFEYYGAWANIQGRGFQAFETIRTEDSRYVSPYVLTHYEYYETTFPWSGMKYQDIESYSGGFYATQSVGAPNSLTQATLSTTSNQERYFPYFTQWTSYQSEVNDTSQDYGEVVTTAVTNYTYDNYGNALTIDTTVTDSDQHSSPYHTDTWMTNTTNTPDVDTTHWCLNLFTETVVAYSASIGGSVTRTKTFTPDTTNCRYTQIVTEPTANSGNYKVTEALTFDSFGNVATDTVTGANMPSSPASRETQMNWGTTGQFLNYLIDPSGAKTTWKYTSNSALTFGVPDSMTDANNVTTSWGYTDGFGRKTSEARADGTSTAWTYTQYDAWDGFIYFEVAEQPMDTQGNILTTNTYYYDQAGRYLNTSSVLINGGTAWTDIRYFDQFGRIAYTAPPYPWTGNAFGRVTNSYDVLNRVVSVTRPVNANNLNTFQSTNYSYSGRTTTVTDFNGNTRTLVTDVNGWLRKATDALGYAVTRAYDAAGSLTGITDSLGNTLLSGVTVVYGIKPFVTTANDIDRGAWTFKVDSLGERYQWTDAKGNSFSMSYDELSRPSSRTEVDLFTEWNYGTAAPNFGRLTSECTAAASTTNLCTTSGSSWLYNESRNYDSIARLQYRSIAESGNPGNDTNPATGATGVYLYTSSYTPASGPANGLLYTLTYPKSTSGAGSPLTLQYGYTYGLLSSVTDTSDITGTCGTTCVLWTATAINARGQVTNETLGSGVQTSRSYDGVTSWLTAATAGVNGGAGLLNQSYLQDKNGNVTQRQDGVHSLYENFYYDADNRLCAAVLNGTGTCTSSTIVYDNGSAGSGNITNQPGVGAFSYPAAGQPRPHAVTSINGIFNGTSGTAIPFYYDPNGNMTARASSSQNIDWYSSNYPSSISGTDGTGTGTVTFNYGPDRQRWEQVYTGSNPTETTYYVGNGVMPAPAQMEVVFVNGTPTYRHYIYAGSEPVAVYSRTGSTNTMSYFLEDHQGGVSAITTSAGVASPYQSFSAFGQMRNSLSWSGAPTAAQTNALSSDTRQGYTFQTWLGQSMGLNHMNGRVQDAILGRFISPDPIIQDPSNAQNYNRYTYALNNPLMWLDPTGFDICNPGDDDYDFYGCLGATGGYSPCADDADCTIPCGSNCNPPPAGCGIGAFGPCPALAPNPPPAANPPFYTPDLYTPPVWGDPNLSKCLLSVADCNAPAQSQNQNQLQPCTFRQGGCPQPPNNPLCLGSFAFAGLEADGAEASAFMGAVVDSTVSGIDVGPLYEGAVGGEGPAGGYAVTQSATTGRYSGFGFFGASVSAGPLAGLQVGIIASGDMFGVYFESHKGPFAGGSGYAFSSCGTTGSN
jgi:RHS repeat-associated protein